MDELKKWKAYICIVFFLSFIYVIVLVPLSRTTLTLNYIDLMDVVMMNFSSYGTYGLSDFNPIFLVFFLFLFYLLYHHQIDEVKESSSYLSLCLHRTSKRKIFTECLLLLLRHNFILYLVLVGSVIGISLLTEGIIVFKEGQLFVFMLYLLRYFIFIVTSEVVIQVVGICKSSSSLSMIPYYLLTFGVIVDYMSKIHIVTYSSNINVEFYGVISSLLISGFICWFMYVSFKKNKELFV